jgi:sugar phosphate isomerase/epimerase
MGKTSEFGVQSYCFREWKDNADVAKKIAELGLKSVELCAVHADFHDLAKFKDVVDIYKTHDISIVSLGVENLVGEANERDLFACAALAGARHLSVHFKIDSFPRAIEQTKKLADEFGIRVGIHCHGGYSFGGQPEVLDHLIKLGAPQIGLCLDTAWCLQIGPLFGKPLEWIKRYAGHIYGIHFKDFVFAPDGAWRDTIVGEGNLDLPAFVAALEASGFDGMAVLEYEGEKHDPVPALKNCVAALHRAIGSNAL